MHHLTFQDSPSSSKPRYSYISSPIKVSRSAGDELEYSIHSIHYLKNPSHYSRFVTAIRLYGRSRKGKGSMVVEDTTSLRRRGSSAGSESRGIPRTLILYEEYTSSPHSTSVWLHNQKLCHPRPSSPSPARRANRSSPTSSIPPHESSQSSATTRACLRFSTSGSS